MLDQPFHIQTDAEYYFVPPTHKLMSAGYPLLGHKIAYRVRLRDYRASAPSSLDKTGSNFPIIFADASPF